MDSCQSAYQGKELRSVLSAAVIAGEDYLP
jgi:hypothetical protein